MNGRLKFNLEELYLQSDSGRKRPSEGGAYDHLPQRGSCRNENFLSRSRLQITATHSAVAWFSDVVTHVPESDSGSGRPIPRGRTRPSGLRLLGYSGSQTLLLHLRKPREGDRQLC